MFAGNLLLVKDFKELVKANKLAQGYIFFGDPQIGKFTFAKSMANFLENGEFEISKRLLSDVMTVDAAARSDSLKSSSREGLSQGGIDSMRELKAFLQQKPIISLKKTIIIDNAGELTPQAQNAILKISEEPTSKALIILVVNQLDELLPPLLSRFQKIYFGRASEEDLMKFLADEYKINKQEAKVLAENSYGRIGRAVELLNNPLMEQMQEMAEKFLKSSTAARSKTIKDLVEAQKENPRLLDYFMEFLIIRLRKDPVKNLNLLKSALNRLFLIKSYNTNKRLQIEAII
ncbi:MAG: DNA polymerase III subunit delta' [Parcubacteria group bacterium Athens0714_26]|nr:MAG: DNA polymerase III subunit delta' [Parcubacteria group bacterium Athens1014_26]TSD03545.1 MAG: DNA polymerase III subunit delta' [Parcubacteria group bacterium Athens0714_26]